MTVEAAWPSYLGHLTGGPQGNSCEIAAIGSPDLPLVGERCGEPAIAAGYAGGLVKVGCHGRKLPRIEVRLERTPRRTVRPGGMNGSSGP